MGQRKVIDLGYCPRCLSEWPMMTRDKWGIRWCHLCSFDLEEANVAMRQAAIRNAKELKGPPDGWAPGTGHSKVEDVLDELKGEE